MDQVEVRTITAKRMNSAAALSRRALTSEAKVGKRRGDGAPRLQDGRDAATERRGYRIRKNRLAGVDRSERVQDLRSAFDELFVRTQAAECLQGRGRVCGG